MQAQQDIRQFRGAVFVVTQDKVLLRKGYGLADMEWNISHTPDSKCCIGSITKQFTAASILQLVEEGKLSLDDKLSKFYPDFPNGDKVTIHMLLSHTSGIPSYTSQKDFNSVGGQSFSLDSMIGFFKNRPYDFSPGTNWLYNNSGYFLLGAIIEKLSNMSYTHYLRKNIFDKLGMQQSGLVQLDTILSNRARGYERKGKNFINAEFISMEWPFSAGAIYSTIDDLYKWDRASYGECGLLKIIRKKKYKLPSRIMLWDKITR